MGIRKLSCGTPQPLFEARSILDAKISGVTIKLLRKPPNVSPHERLTDHTWRRTNPSGERPVDIKSVSVTVGPG